MEKRTDTYGIEGLRFIISFVFMLAYTFGFVECCSKLSVTGDGPSVLCMYVRQYIYIVHPAGYLPFEGILLVFLNLALWMLIGFAIGYFVELLIRRHMKKTGKSNLSTNEEEV